jgi:hypothetical protein
VEWLKARRRNARAVRVAQAAREAAAAPSRPADAE